MPRAKNNPWKDVAGALSERYKTQDPALIGDMFAREIGLGPYKIPVVSQMLNPWKSPMEEGFSMGQFVPLSRTVRLEQRLTPEEIAGTLPHELAHVADFVDSGYTPGPENTEGFSHHRDFASFEAELPRVLNMQKEIEMGLPVASTRSRRYPWLGDLNPLSSNPMAHPWKKKQKAFPVDIWNALQEER